MAEILLAFDWGEKRIGVAVGNTLTGHARPLTVIASVEVKQRFAAITQLLQEWQPARLVVGVPSSFDGQPHPVAQRCLRFANQLEGRYGLPVVRVDEAYSSAEAASNVRGRNPGPIDAESAAIFLEQVLQPSS